MVDESCVDNDLRKASDYKIFMGINPQKDSPKKDIQESVKSEQEEK